MTDLPMPHERTDPSLGDLPSPRPWPPSIEVVASPGGTSGNRTFSPKGTKRQRKTPRVAERAVEMGRRLTFWEMFARLSPRDKQRITRVAGYYGDALTPELLLAGLPSNLRRKVSRTSEV